MAEARAGAAEPRSRLLHDVSLSVLGRAIEYDDAALDELLSARHFVSVRTTPGGPAPSETARAIAASRKLLESDEEVAERTRAGKLHAAEEELKEAASQRCEHHRA